MNIEIGAQVLVTTDNWFFAADGKSYRAIWGTVRAIRDDKETLGIKTNARSTNWYAEIGDTLVAGCQIHYAVRCGQPPPEKVADYKTMDSGLVVEFQKPSDIWNADASGSHNGQ